MNIPALNKVVDAYQEAKEARCQESPKEMAAKTALQMKLHQHRSELPTDANGQPFYRHEGRIYTLAEKLMVKSEQADTDED